MVKTNPQIEVPIKGPSAKTELPNTTISGLRRTHCVRISFNVHLMFKPSS